MSIGFLFVLPHTSSISQVMHAQLHFDHGKVGSLGQEAISKEYRVLSKAHVFIFLFNHPSQYSRALSR